MKYFSDKQEERNFEDAIIALNYDGHRYDDWFHLKNWLWEKYKWRITVRRFVNEFTYEIWNQNNAPVEYGVKYNSPILAEIEGIKASVLYLYSPISEGRATNE